METASECDLRERGVYNYAQDHTTKVLCMSYAYDDGDVQTWTPGQPMPEIRGQVRAHNAAFERLIFWHVLKMPIPLEQFYCTAAQARANCAPGSLEDVGRFAGAAMRKDTRGPYLVRKCCTPPFRQDLLPELYEYCEQDVRTMRAVSKMLRELTDEELADYHVNERINDRGVRIDRDLCLAAVQYAENERVEIESTVREVTNGEVLSVRSPRMRKWVMERVGPQALKLMERDGKYSTDKTVRANLLALDDPEEVPPDVKEVIQCADDLWASSVAKFDRLARLAAVDDRVRGAFVFAGGSATGRASSYGAQVHNFTRKCAEHPEAVRRAMVHGHAIVPHHGRRVTDVLRGMLRPALIPAEGKTFVVADWSAIEGRVNPWLSGRGDAKLKQFREGLDVYKVNAAETFRTTYDAVTKDQRQIGKVQELACVSEDTLVLTDAGWMAIVDVSTDHKLWDGISWVTHKGPIQRGVKPTISVCGMYATEDHLFLAQREWIAAKTVHLSSAFQTQALATGSANLPWSTALWRNTAWQKRDALWSNAPAVRLHTWSNYTIFLKAHLRAAIHALEKRLGSGEKITSNTPRRVLTTRIAGGYLIDYLRVRTAATTQKIVGMLTMAGAGLSCMNLGVPTKPLFCAMSSHWMGGISQTWIWTASTWIKATNRAIYGSYRAERIATINGPSAPYSVESTTWRPVYDIVEAGPNNRFTVLTNSGPMIVHNCGFGGGIGAFAAMGRVYGVHLPEAQARSMVDAWRRANAWALPFWGDLEEAYNRALRNKGRVFTAGRISYVADKNHLWYCLPSGRVLCYPFARFEENGDITYAKAAWKPAADAKAWPRARLWRGLACENVTQATAHDLLREALRRLPGVVLHVHDEIVLETDQPEAAKAALIEAMTTPPAWAEGLPLDVEASIMGRYGK
jgi:hypothetical protein